MSVLVVMVTFVLTPLMTTSSAAVGRTPVDQLAAWCHEIPSPPPVQSTVSARAKARDRATPAARARRGRWFALIGSKL
jgi:hypothetical protein